MLGSAQLFAVSVSFLVTCDTKSHEVLGCVIAEATPRLNVMDLKILQFARRLGSANRPVTGLHDRDADSFQGRAQASPLPFAKKVPGTEHRPEQDKMA